MEEITAKKTDVSQTGQDRIRRIRSEMISSCFGLHDEETFLFSFLDYIHLHLQPTQEFPLAFSIWRDSQCVFSSFRDLYYTNSPYALHQRELTRPSRGIRIFEDKDYWLCVHNVSTQALRDLEAERADNRVILEDMELQNRILPIANENYLNQTFLLLRSIDDDFGTRLDKTPRYKELLLSSLSMSSRTDYPISINVDKIPNLNYQAQIVPLLSTFRDVLDEVFHEMNVSLFDEHDPRLGNIFCVVRTVQSNIKRLNSFPYTASLLLSSRQRKVFAEWYKGGCDKTQCQFGVEPRDCLGYFEVPLGEHSRSAADVTFCSGIIDFGRQAGDGVWDRVDPREKSEQCRKSVERCVYPREPNLDMDSRGKHTEPSLYYIPVHVNGIPWIVLFTFTPSPLTQEKEQARWEHNFTFYRKATQKALAYLRWRAEEAYLTELVSAAFGQGVSWQSPPSEIQNRVNEFWEIAARVFPFPKFTLHSAESGFVERDNCCAPLPSIPGRVEHWVVEVDKEVTYYGPRQVEWGKVGPENLLRKLSGMMASQISTWERLSGTESTRTAAYSTHLLKTPIGELSDRVNLLPEGNDKKALSLIADVLHTYATFAMATIDKRRWSTLQKGMKSLGTAAYADYVKNDICSNLSRLANKKVFGDSDTEVIARRLLSRHDLVEIDQGWASLAGVVEYHPLQTSVVLLEGMANALYGLVGTDGYCTIRLLLQGACTVTVEIVNATAREPEEVDLDVKRANGGSADLLGITNIRQACEALGFAAPEWFRDATQTGATVMGVLIAIGRYNNNAEVVAQ